MNDIREILQLREVLYQAIVELSYVQDSPDHSLCASAKGRAIIDKGMEVLRVKDLSLETLHGHELMRRDYGVSQ